MKRTKQIISAVLVLAMLAGSVVAFSVTSGAVNGVDLPAEAEGKVYNGTPSTSLEGAGTEANPYQIASAEDFVYFLQDRCHETATNSVAKTKGLYYKLMCDIYLNAQNSTAYSLPVMNDTNGYRNFGGVLDGDGHTLYNPYAKSTASAIFNRVAGTVENLTVAGAYFYTTTNAAVLATTLSGATVQNVHLTDSEIIWRGSGVAVGGIASVISGASVVDGCSVSDTCSISCSATSTKSFVGGIIGSPASDSANASIIRNCVNYGKVSHNSKTYGGAGGILGGSYTTTSSLNIVGCENRGTITDAGISAGVGGIAGYVSKGTTLTVSQCKNSADLNSTDGAGGIIGLVVYPTNIAPNITVSSCENTGKIQSTSCAGGFIGRMTDAYKSTITISDSANYGDVTAGNYAGGMIGYYQMNNQKYVTGKLTFVNCATYGNVTAKANYAGLVTGSYQYTKNDAQDKAVPCTVANCVLVGQVSAAGNAAAIVGYLSCLTPGVTEQTWIITDSYVKSDVVVADGGTAATIAGGAGSTLTEVNLTTTNSAFDVKVTVGEAVQAEPATYFTAETTPVIAELPAMGATALTDRTAVGTLNTYASDNRLTMWIQGKTAPEFAPQVKVDGATLTLGAEMTLKFFVTSDSLTEIAEKLNKIYVTDGTPTGVYAGVYDSASGNYVFEVTDLAAKDFATDVTYKVQYTLKDDTATLLTCTTGVDYSPVTYATRMYNKADAAQTHYKNLLVALVQYASVAAADSETEEDETATILANFKTATGYDLTSGYGNYEAIKVKDLTSTFTYAENASSIADMGASLTGSLNLILTQKNASYTAVTAKIGEAELEVVKSDGTWVIKGLYASDLYNEITFTFTGDGVEPVVATYSVARFLSNYGGDYAALAQATAIYMDAAYAYASGN